MAVAKKQTLTPPPTGYEEDGFLWHQEQVALLRARRFDELDLENVIVEMEDMGNEKRNALMSSYRVLMMHLLKWEFQPEKRSMSWYSTILRERGNIEDRLQESPSLKTRRHELLARAYKRAAREAAGETNMPRSAFPVTNRYTFEQLDDFDFLPGPAKPDPRD
ncbi:MAG: DUF29 domain-containing protein [Pseudomonadota bacterium]